MIQVAFKGVGQAARMFGDWADDKQKQMHKAMSTALKVEGYRLTKQIKVDLKAGRLGLEAKEIYQNKPGDKRYRKKRKTQPLARLAPGISYFVDWRKLALAVGFGVRQAATGAGGWTARIAVKSIPGYRMPISEGKKQALHSIGIHLRKSTESAGVPSRDIMEAVLAKEGNVILSNIRENYLRKMAGERI